MMLYFIQESRAIVGFSDRQKIQSFADFYSNNKPVAFVCHSPGALKNVKVNGEFLVRKKTYRFSNAEEAAVGLNVVPFY
jgi:putative intracellular protease/amidase